MRENEIARQVVDVAFQLHTKLGPGLLQSVYQKIMAHELRKRYFARSEWTRRGDAAGVNLDVFAPWREACVNRHTLWEVI